MDNSRTTAQSRQSLDARFENKKEIERLRTPVRGWIKAIREGLGMSTAQLAKRMDVKQPTVAAMEQSEIKETIQLSTLRRAAEAMNCTLVYALVPNDSLENIVRDQARKVALHRLKSVEHSMLLERQSVPTKEFEKRIEALAHDLRPSIIWNEP